jgi:S1-C subfamily serine protease
MVAPRARAVITLVPAGPPVVTPPPARGHNRRVNLPVNLLDVGALVALVVFAVLGWRSGALPQFFVLLGAALGVAIVVLGAQLLVSALSDLEPFLRAVIAVAAAFFVVAMAEAIGSSVGVLLRERLGRGVAGTLDSVGGALFGAGQALLLVWLVGGLLATGPMPPLAREAQRSTAVRSLMTILPAPSEVIGELSSIIDASGLPQAFSGLEPAPAPPVDTPGSAEARQMASGAMASVVRVDSTACGRRYTGTGFEAAPGYVVTNAHVVAGSTGITVTSDLGGGHAPGTLVFIDPDLDVAVIRTPGLRLPVLRFASESPKRGTVAAALGHPNAAPLTVVPAGVTASIRARGRDIYGSGTVVRDVLELRAAVEPGDSGGPLILADGTVGGVVFAESRTDPDVGYALDPLVVASTVGPALGATAAVDPGACAP